MEQTSASKRENLGTPGQNFIHFICEQIDSEGNEPENVPQMGIEPGNVLHTTKYLYSSRGSSANGCPPCWVKFEYQNTHNINEVG